MIVLSSDTAVKELLDKRSAIYSDRQDHYVGHQLAAGGQHMFMMPYGSTWRMVREGSMSSGRSIADVPLHSFVR